MKNFILRLMLVTIIVTGTQLFSRAYSVEEESEGPVVCPTGDKYKCSTTKLKDGDYFITYKGEGEVVVN
mgnify:CR=1 FL=1|jgi:hypothetical protein